MQARKTTILSILISQHKKSMNKIASYNEKRLYVAVELSESQIEKALITLKPHLLKVEKLPRIINENKTYETFDFRALNIQSENPILGLRSNDIAQTPDEKSQSLLNRRFLLIEYKESLRHNNEFRFVKLEITLNAKFFSHTELLQRLISEDFHLSAYEAVGDIIHLNLTEEQEKFKKLIADVLFFKTGKTVINKIGKIEDTFRFYKNEILAGGHSLVTTHKENGVKFIMDLGEVYWCSRLQSERIRILGMVRKGQVVCDPFCGVGPHIIPAIKKDAYGLCNDLNPNAIKWLKKSLEINNLTCNVVENMDAAAFLESLKGQKIDHLIFNLPEFSLEYLRYAQNFSGFWLHVFFFCKDKENFSEMINQKTGFKIDPSWVRECRKVSPSKSVMKLEVYDLDFFRLQRDQSN